MPVKYSVKRNSLSSKWGVWATDTDAPSPVENLLVEFKKSEDAESYHSRIEAGEAHTDILASLSARKSKPAGEGGFLGKLFKRGSNGAGPVAETVVNNPVIEIPAPSKREGELSAEAIDEIAVETKPGSRVEAPSRFQVIEQPPAPAPPPLPVAEVEEPERVVADDAPPATTESEHDQVEASQQNPEIELEPLPEATLPEEQNEEIVAESVDEVEASEEVTAEVEAAPEENDKKVEPEPVVSEVTAEPEEAPPAPRAEQAAPVVPVEPEIIPVATKSSVAPVVETPQESQQRDKNRLVDWTFTPPPDVTPEELRASGATIPGAPAAAKNREEGNRIDPEWADPAASVEPDSNGKTAEITGGNGLSQNPGTGRVTVDICVSKALGDLSNGDARISDKKYNSIASKEYTEVSKAFAAGNTTDHLREELTHLAAVCLAWADAIEKRQSTDADRKAA